ncbi:ABC-F family ATP-binding cassette domain-containing protein [Aureibacillus halotolerans]|uniref:ATP-binding cassette subfamily F protein 3 n=1 Tax=Aureibacillus halotolerans TaxID=1508390 RepID=A0A4R6TTE7_9BACI|nr:ABC-F family ATP-binding cassette domain-containing protein [Aureibacillus halotolerans]TDQ35223.1 ATP-binding cassette subfamily F protein 3 [Aureibacillus halotolerans]
MIILQANQLSKAYGAETILSSIKMEIKHRDRVAVVGRNGAGKSTLLKMIAGELPHDGGELIIPNAVSVGYLPQQAVLSSDKSIWDEMLDEFSDLLAIEQRIRLLETKMGSEETLSNEASYNKIMKEYDTLRADFEARNGYQLEADIRGILSGLQFNGFDYYHTTVSSLSGGQKTRLALGKLLLTKPDLLILDEPTNHLDIDTLTWLEGYLQGYPGALLLVSHDRYFLDKIVNQVYEISRTHSQRFSGNYSYYQEQKALQYERDLKEFEKQQSEKHKLEDFVQRNIARASTTKRAQSRQKQLERRDWMDRPDGLEKSVAFTFPTDQVSGHDVLRVRDVTLQYDDQKEPLFPSSSFHIDRGERTALVGPNGVGKTTLLHMLRGQMPPSTGSFQLGSNITLGFYDQEQAQLRSTKTVLQELWDRYPSFDEKDIRTVLGNFLFSGDDCLKIVNTLSGGEKARLALAILMLKKANVLLLDEPTNHLDIDAKEVLEAALSHFSGTILFVSHDRYFMNQIATKVLELLPSGLTTYLGDYDYYLRKKEEEKERLALDALEQPKTDQEDGAQNESKESFEQQKDAKRKKRQQERRMAEIEELMQQTENEINALETALLQPETYEDHEKAHDVQLALQQANQTLEDLLVEWDECSTDNA